MLQDSRTLSPGEGQNLTPSFGKYFADDLHRAGNILLGMRHAEKACLIRGWSKEYAPFKAGMEEGLPPGLPPWRNQDRTRHHL